MTRWVRVPLMLCAAWLALFEVHAVALPGLPVGPVKTVHLVVMVVAAALCIARAVAQPRERLAWSLIALGISSWIAGEIYYSFVLWDLENIPIPSPADAGYLLMPPLLFAGLFLLLRERVRGLGPTLAVDGLTAALAVSAVAAAWVLGAVMDVAGGRTLAVATNLAYPVADLVLLGLIAGGVAASGWRVDRSFALLAAGVVTFWVADSYYLVTTAAETYTPGSAFDAGWWAIAVLFAYAAWQPERGAARAARHDDTRVIVAPIVFSLVGLTVLVLASLTHVNAVAVALAAASLLAVLSRLVITFADHAGMLRSSRHEALTDALTGLGNRRALTLALDRALARASEHEPLTLVMFDLDGFKHYNDSFGHPAGDALLQRLSISLAACLREGDEAFRMGGDEFCALLRDAGAIDDAAVARTAHALAERGDGFSIGCSHGAIVLPAEASEPAEALRIADQRMYACKHGGRASAGRQSKDVLLRALAERDPGLSAHMCGVADLAESVARALSLADEEVECVRQAAELHDVGKVAVPDAILDKPGPLDESEWAFVRRHTIIGERIIAAAPALGRVAGLVRSSHERWDGAGYPDRLRADEIPLGSRIVAVCDAFDAMVCDRPYRRGMSDAAALAELARCAGEQFDSRVVEAFVVAWDAAAGDQLARAA